jgi:IS66 Orf2 like protein
MIHAGIRRVLIAQHRVDFRKRFDGLLGEAYRLGADPYLGDCVVFLKGDHTQLRALSGDALGLFLTCRRFEGGRLRAAFEFIRDPAATTITTAELALLFEGASFTVHRRVRAWRRSASPSTSVKPAPTSS